MKHGETAPVIRRLFDQVRGLPASARHPRMLELGADPLQIAEVDAMLIADAETSAWADGQSQRSGKNAQAKRHRGARNSVLAIS